MTGTVYSGIAKIDTQLAAVRSALATFESTCGDFAATDSVAAAWNALHDAESDLIEQRRAYMARGFVGKQRTALADLVAQNID